MLKAITTSSTAALAFGVLSACSVTPYDSDFSCKSDDYGLCIHPEGAYALAVGSTEPNVAPVGGPSAAEDAEPVNRRQRKRRDRSRRQAAATTTTIATEVSAYEGYQNAVYREVAGIVEQPITPMLTPPKVVRTLIMPYSGQQTDGNLYMPRYVYSIIEGPRFVMGDYLAETSGNDLASQIANGDWSGFSPVPALPSPVDAEPVQLREDDERLEASTDAPPANVIGSLLPKGLNLGSGADAR